MNDIKGKRTIIIIRNHWWSPALPLPPTAPLQSMTLHCGTCALVTSSSHVLGTHAGAEIDSSDCVIRMNDAPTVGFQADVGNRTSLRVVAHSSVFRVARQPAEFLNLTGAGGLGAGPPEYPVVVFWGPPNKISKDAKGTLYRLIRRVSMTYSNLSFYTIAPGKMRKFDTLFQTETGRDRWLFKQCYRDIVILELLLHYGSFCIIYVLIHTLLL